MDTKAIYKQAFDKAKLIYKALPKGTVKQNEKDFCAEKAHAEMTRLGFKKVKEDYVLEANAVSSLAQVTRHKESFQATLRESVQEDKRTVEVIILKEGKGNPRDKHYYSQEALTSAIQLFEGAQCYADHPSSFEEQTRPERSVRDVVGHFQNVRVEMIEGASCLVGDLKIVKGESYDWAWDLIKESVEFTKKFQEKSLIGISINADGESMPFELEGNTWHKVTKIDRVVSADLVQKSEPVESL